MNVNVYDFDNTIYDGETLVDFILYYVKGYKNMEIYSETDYYCN